MANALILIGVFATIAMIIAGGKIIMQLTKVEREKGKTSKRKIQATKKLHISDVRKSLSLGNFTINKPKEWELDEVELEIRDYDYDSTKISVDDLKALRYYIDEILNSI